MTVGELKKLIAELPDDTPVLAFKEDHHQSVWLDDADADIGNVSQKERCPAHEREPNPNGTTALIINV